MQLSFWIFFKHHTTFSLSVLSVQGVIRHTKSSSADVPASGAHSPHGSKLFLTSTDPAGTLGLHISEKHSISSCNNWNNHLKTAFSVSSGYHSIISECFDDIQHFSVRNMQKENQNIRNHILLWKCHHVSSLMTL